MCFLRRHASFSLIGSFRSGLTQKCSGSKNVSAAKSEGTLVSNMIYFEAPCHHGRCPLAAPRYPAKFHSVVTALTAIRSQRLVSWPAFIAGRLLPLREKHSRGLRAFLQITGSSSTPPPPPFLNSVVHVEATSWCSLTRSVTKPKFSSSRIDEKRTAPLILTRTPLLPPFALPIHPRSCPYQHMARCQNHL